MRHIILFLAVGLAAALVSCRGDVLSVEDKTPPPPKVAAAPEPLPDPDKPALTPEQAAMAEVENSTVDETTNIAETVRPMPLVLAMSWQAGFCEGHEKKSECQSQRADRYDATHFTLHGLWPQPRRNVYCGVSKRNQSRDKAGNWLDLPAVQTSVTTKKRLVRVMPGTRSRLDRHEWIKHGTCYSQSAETYYRHSIALMDRINASAVQKLFASNIGKRVSTTSIRAAFDDSFGSGTGKRVRVSCKRDGKRTLITELTLGLVGTVGNNPDIGSLAARSKPISAGCPGGIVDAIGLQ